MTARNTRVLKKSAVIFKISRTVLSPLKFELGDIVRPMICFNTSVYMGEINVVNRPLVHVYFFEAIHDSMYIIP